MPDLLRSSTPLVRSPASTTQAPRYALHVTREPAAVAAAQRLRYDVFAGEMGANVRGSAPGVESDEFDEHCDHLVVRDEQSGEVVGTYRMLPPERARTIGGLYADHEFDLSTLNELRPSLVETGRSCVRCDHRGGAVVNLVWAGIARYLLSRGHRWLAGCASVPLGDGGATAAGVWRTVRLRYYSPDDQRVIPRVPWPVDSAQSRDSPVIPPLLRGYLRLGARVCGPPALDPEFGVADFFVLLDVHAVDQRYLKHFLGSAV